MKLLSEWKRRKFLQHLGLGSLASVMPSLLPGRSLLAMGDDKPPNVLFIAIDDLNDWIEPLGGHPQAKTPNMNRFAKRAVNFTHNYCTSAGCNPSRSTLMSGIHTYEAGMYSNYQDWRKAMPNAVTIGEYLQKQGYYSAGAGKIFHYDQVEPKCWSDYYPSQTNNMPQQFYPNRGETVNMPKFEDMYGDFDWSPLTLTDEETADFKSVNYISEQLARAHDTPFFLACGIYRPHLPWYVPKKYFDMFPIDDIQLPLILENDIDDLQGRILEVVTRGGNYHKHVIEAGQWKPAVRGYLASIAFADAMMGRLLDNLAASAYADNTIVVLWSDHGWQLGEKEHWRKFAMWENVVRTPMMIHVPKGVPGLPGGSANGVSSHRLTSLVDIYPTILSLCGLPERPELSGHDMTPLLKNPDAEWHDVAISTLEYGEFSVRTPDWRYILYIDGSEELYDHRIDREEWHNLAYDPDHAAVKAHMISLLPKNPAPLREETLIELEPHHVAPYRDREDYFSRQSK